MRKVLLATIGVLFGTFIGTYLARAQDAPPAPPAVAAPAKATAADLPDPFKPSAAMKALGEGETLPPLSCAKAEVFRAAVKAHGGSSFLKLSPLQEAYWKGFYSALPFTPAGFPVGDGVIVAVRVVEGDESKHEKPHMTGVAAFTLGDALICNAVPVNGQLLDALFKVGGAKGET